MVGEIDSRAFCMLTNPVKSFQMDLKIQIENETKSLKQNKATRDILRPQTFPEFKIMFAF